MAGMLSKGYVGILILLSVLLTLLLSGSGCTQTAQPSGEDQVQVMATTSVVADIVRQVGGGKVNVEILLPSGTDPHSFNPTPNDISRLSDAQLIFINGAGLEEFLAPMIESAGVEARIVDLSATIPQRSLEEGASHTGEDGGDPHTWMDPNNMIVWVPIIAQALIQLDPDQGTIYQQNAEQLQAELVALDGWVQAQVEQIPPESRQLVTDHLVFGYFADRYGFRQVGAIVQGYSTLSEPSAQELANLEDEISRLGVPVIFVSWTANQNLADRIAEDTGVQVIPLFTHSLSAKGGEADTYQNFIRYNVTAIVDALK